MSQENVENQVPAPRLPLSLSVDFKRSYARNMSPGRLKNISLTGAFLETETLFLSPADKVSIQLRVGGRNRKLQARVVWKNQSGCGLAFQPSSHRDVQMVDDLMYFVENNREGRKSVLDSILNKVS